MVLFNKGKLRKFKDIYEIISVFCEERLHFYELRKKRILSNLTTELNFLRNKRKFLEAVINKKLEIFRVDEKILTENLIEMGFDKLGEKKNFDYLLNMNIRSFTKEKLEKLQKEIGQFEKELEKVTKMTEKRMWLNDLTDLEKKL